MAGNQTWHTLHPCPCPQHYASDRVLVKLKQQSSTRVAALSTEGVELQGSVGRAGAQVYQIVDGSSVQKKIKQLTTDPGRPRGCGTVV